MDAWSKRWRGPTVDFGAGDSRAVLSVSGGCALPLTQDHRLTRPDELARIRSAGGLVVNHRLNGASAGPKNRPFEPAAKGGSL